MGQIPDWYGSTGDGWNAILTILHNELMKVCPEYEAAQVKEKFGSLRAYLDFPEGVSPAARNSAYELERKYEAFSQFTCEHCGKTGTNKANSHGWWSTLCDPCREVSDDYVAQKRAALKGNVTSARKENTTDSAPGVG